MKVLDLDHIKQEIKVTNVLAILSIRRLGKSVFTWLLMRVNFFIEGKIYRFHVIRERYLV